MKKMVHIAMLLLWMALIFWFSAKPADESTDMSMRVGYFVCNLFVPDFDTWSDSEQYALAEKIDYPVRKLAHATEYALMAVLLVITYGDYEKTVKRKYTLALMSAAGYAATDEFHQLFVPGRSGQVSDVLIDSCGALFGLLFFLILTRLFQKK